MKKTVLALSFALCASFAFAQTKKVGSINKIDANRAMEAVSMDQLQEANFNGSIFTKEDPEPFKTWDFSTAEQVTTGIVTGTADTTVFLLPNETPVSFKNHGNTNDYTKWRRLTSASDPILDNQALYPGWSVRNANWRRANGFTMLEFRFDTARTKTTSDRGMMFMSMSESGPAENQPLNAYFDLGTVSTTGKAIVDVRFFQFYLNYYDECYIDYKIGNQEWHTLPINVDGIDVEINGMLWNWTTYTLPIAIANQESVQLRFRYYSFKRGSAYGYWWAIDDVSLIEGSADRWELWQAQYAEGAYQTMPKGLDLPLLWYTKARNNGVNEKTNIVTTVTQYDHMNQEDLASIVTKDQDNVPANISVIVPFVMDPAGWHTSATSDSINRNPEDFGWYSESLHRNVTGKGLSTANVGDNYVYSTVSSNGENGIQSFDTICYNVNCEGEDGDRIWAYDNGILGRHQFFGFGFTNDGFLSDTGHFANANYRVTNRYTTGATVPENWVLRGVEMVVNTEPGKAEAHAKIIPIAFKDEYDGNSVSFNSLNTGAGEYEVKASDFDANNVELSTSNYLTPEDNYTTIRIMFPEQPELEPYTSYRIGYQMAEAGQFAVAAQSNHYYVKKIDEDGQPWDSAVFYSRDEALKKYSSFFGTSNGLSVPSYYSTLVYDPQAPQGHSGWTFGMQLTGVPMIRAIVGPKVDLPTYNVTVNCEGNEDAGVATGVIQYGNQEDVCGSQVAIAEGSYPEFAIVPTDGYIASEITLDGEAIDIEVEEHNNDAYEAVHFFGTTDDGQVYDYWIVQIKNVRGEHTLAVKYAQGETQGIDPVAPAVRMNLQPNPATSQVRLSLSGVEGMVNCALIDMSGRVVYSSTMNAENAEVIDLTNVAKGAYFVRITNNEFSKIEKLIVR